MHRLTARFLLLFTLVGTFAPLALAMTAAPPHACCLRKAAHQCHGSAPESDQRTIQDAGCCNHDSGRAVTTSQWASPQPWTTSTIAQNVEARIPDTRTDSPSSDLRASQSTRAPPPISIS
jgi:hypothetical protein